MRVEHIKFGEGTVVNINGGFIVANFSGEEKKFQFPQSFDKFLKTDDAELLILIATEREKKKTEVVSSFKSNSNIIITEKKPVGGFANSSFHIQEDWGASNPLIGDRAQTIPFRSEEEMFEVIGYMATPGRVNSIEAEVPKDGRDKTFEKMFPNQTYRPIELGYTPSGLPNKVGPQFRINFGNLRNCPSILKSNMGKGNGSCVGRINKSKFVITIVQRYGFKFGDKQDVAVIREIAVDKGFEEAFERGYSR